MNQFTLKIALIVMSVSAFADQSDKGQHRHDDTDTAVLYQPGPNNPAADPDGKNANVKAAKEKQGNHLNQSGNPPSLKPIRPGSGSYNRELIH